MTRHAITAMLVGALVVVSGPAMTVGATATDVRGTLTAETVVVQNAQVSTLQLDNSTVENVTIRVLQIDRMTLENQTNGDGLNETLGNQSGPVVLQNVHFNNLSLQNVSATDVRIGGGGAGAANAPPQQGDGVPAVGNVSSAVIPRMTVDHLVVQQANVSEAGGGGLISGLVERIRGLFGGGDQAGNQTVQQPDLRVANVDVNRLTVEQLDVAQVEEVEPNEVMAGNETSTNATNATTPDGMTPNETTPAMGAGAANGTALGQVSVGNVTIDTLSADAMVYQRPGQQAGANETETPAANETTPAANESTPTPF